MDSYTYRVQTSRATPSAIPNEESLEADRDIQRTNHVTMVLDGTKVVLAPVLTLIKPVRKPMRLKGDVRQPMKSPSIEAMSLVADFRILFGFERLSSGPMVETCLFVFGFGSARTSKVARL